MKSFLASSKGGRTTGKRGQTASAKYNNMVMQGSWKNIDAKDSKLVALLTKVTNLEEKLKNSSSSSTAGQKGRSAYFTLDDWRMKFDGNVSKVVAGKTWHWCKRHIQEGVYDGLYVTHKQEDHDDWVELRKNWNKNKKPSAGAPSDSNKSGSTPSADKLTLSNNLKAAMVTNFQCTSEQAEKLWSEVVQDLVN